ncbi:MAG: hypothetical protein ABI266_02455 [Ginsengibacter sp.]
MKKALSILFIFSVILFGCNNSDEKNEEVVYETVRDTASSPLTGDSGMVIQNSPLLWSVELEKNSQIEKIKKIPDSKVETLTAEEITNELNKNFDDIPLQFVKTSHDTAFVKITDSQKFTNQIGSTGAYNYMATVVYNLTEIKNIRFVKFDFKEGDHALPGVFSREDFKNLR